MAAVSGKIAMSPREHHAHRLEMVLRELRKRARHHPAPHLIGRAIEGLEAELAAVRRRLGQR